MLSTEERVEIVILMAKLESTAAVRRALQRGVKVPSENTIRDTFKKFKETGSVHNRPKSGRPVLSDEKVKEISNFFVNVPQTSLRFLAKEIGCSFKNVHNIVRQKPNLFRYKIQMTQLLHDEDLGLRTAMCETLLEKIDADENFPDRLIFSDNCTFFLNGMVNRHNCRIWAKETPMDTIPKTHSSLK